MSVASMRFGLRGLKLTPHGPYPFSRSPCDLPSLVSLLLRVLASAPTFPSGHSAALGPHPHPNHFPKYPAEAMLGTEAARDLQLPRVGPPPSGALSSLASGPHSTFFHSRIAGSP